MRQYGHGLRYGLLLGLPNTCDGGKYLGVCIYWNLVLSLNSWQILHAQLRRIVSLVLSGQFLLTEEVVTLLLMWKLNRVISEHVGGVVVDGVQGVVVHDKGVVDTRVSSVQVLDFVWLPYYFDVDLVFLGRPLHLHNLLALHVKGVMRGLRFHFDRAHLELLYLWRLVILIISLLLSFFLHLLRHKIINLQFGLIVKALTHLVQTFMACLSFKQVVARPILLMKHTSHQPLILSLCHGALQYSGSQRDPKLLVFFIDFRRNVDLLFENFR